jgi:cell division protein FtsB
MADYRLLALEHTTDDLMTVAARSAFFREFLSVAIERVRQLERQLAAQSRRIERLIDEQRDLRARLRAAADRQAA